MAALEALFRWIHIVAGIMWIGHLYFFNFVNKFLLVVSRRKPRELLSCRGRLGGRGPRRT